MGIKEPYSSLTSYVTNPVVNITIMSLIIIGGLGFFTWEDIKKINGDCVDIDCKVKLYCW